jgi:hypothetical protein
VASRFASGYLDSAASVAGNASTMRGQRSIFPSMVGSDATQPWARIRPTSILLAVSALIREV